MAISDSTYLGLEARGTAGSTIVKSAVLSLALVLSQYPLPRLDSGENGVRLAGTEETCGVSFLLQASEMELLFEMNRIYDDLLKNQVELDVDSKRTLYSNLWDFYT
jgi:hypothetical protein